MEFKEIKKLVKEEKDKKDERVFTIRNRDYPESLIRDKIKEIDRQALEQYLPATGNMTVADTRKYINGYIKQYCESQSIVDGLNYQDAKKLLRDKSEAIIYFDNDQVQVKVNLKPQ